MSCSGSMKFQNSFEIAVFIDDYLNEFHSTSQVITDKALLVSVNESLSQLKIEDFPIENFYIDIKVENILKQGYTLWTYNSIPIKFVQSTGVSIEPKKMQKIDSTLIKEAFAFGKYVDNNGNSFNLGNLPLEYEPSLVIKYDRSKNSKFLSYSNGNSLNKKFPQAIRSLY